MSSPTSGATWATGRQFDSGNHSSRRASSPQLDKSNDERPSIGFDSPEFDPMSGLNADDASDQDDQISFLDSELEDEQLTVPRLASSILRENHENALRVFEATEAQVEELKQRVNALEEEKLASFRSQRTSSEILEAEIETLGAQLRRLAHDNINLRARIQEHAGKLSTMKEELEEEKRQSNEALQAQDAEFQERVAVLERQLDVVVREKTALSQKVNKSGKSAPASASLQKQYVEYLNGDMSKLVASSFATRATGLREEIKNLKNEKDHLQHRLIYERQTRAEETREIRGPPWKHSTNSEEDLANARAEIERL